jgi:hypothetical protein
MISINGMSLGCINYFGGRELIPLMIPSAHIFLIYNSGERWKSIEIT